MIALLLASALAGELRLGVFVGNDHGGTGEQQLLFATSDAEKMRDRFVQTGAMTPEHALLLRDRSKRDVGEALREVRLAVERAKADGDDTVVVFYYSGHGDDHGLHLGTSTLPHDELRALLDATGADVRLALLDACQSGAVVRSKGAVRGPSAAMAVDVDRIRGTAYLTSSAANEFSQESEEVGGGFFTHYLHTALAGAADLDLDGQVTLAEAYSFVHTETSLTTRETAEQQTPSFDLDLSGSGQLWLTRLDDDNSQLRFPGDMPGTWAVWDDSRRRYIGEVEGSDPSTLAVAPGVYYVQHRRSAYVEQARYAVGEARAVTVNADDFAAVAYEQTASRGPLERQARRARMPDLQLQAVLGGRGFGEGTPTGSQYLPTHLVGGVRARWLRERGPYFEFDVVGGGGPGVITLPELGAVNVNVQSTSLGAGIGFATAPHIARAGIGGRVELISFRRDFPDGEADAQTLTRPAFGVEPWAGLHYGRFSLDLGLGLNWLPVNLDDRVTWPPYLTLALRTGVRF